MSDEPTDANTPEETPPVPSVHNSEETALSDFGRTENDATGDDAGEPRSAQDLEALYDVPVQVSAVLGRARMDVASLMKLGRGAIVELDRKVGEAIDVYVNNRLVARGEVVLVEDQLGVTMTEIIRDE